MNTEIKQLHQYETFQVLRKGEKVPERYKQIPYHCIYDVKYDGRRKCRLVAGGHMTDPASDEVFSGVVNMETVRMAFILAELNGLTIVAGDVGNAYLNARSKENCYIRAGSEFGPELLGLLLLIIKALYGLKSSAARFHEHLSVALRKLGFKASKADPDFWIRDKGDHYDYIARYVDDIIEFSKDPMEVMTELRKTYT